MATSKSNNRPVAPEAETRPKNEPTESVYTAKELAEAYKTFNSSYAIVATALKLAGKDKATVSETKELVEKFEKREVK